MPDGPMNTFGELLEIESMTSMLLECFNAFKTSASLASPWSIATNMESGGWWGLGLSEGWALDEEIVAGLIVVGALNGFS